MTVIFSDTACV